MPKIKIVPIFTIALILSHIHIFGMKADNSLKIQGKIINKSSDVKLITIEFYNHYSQDLDGINCKSIKVILKHGKFAFETPVINDLAYVKFKIDNERYFYISQELFLVTAGDNISLTVDANTYVFAGKGAGKYNYISQSSEIRTILDQPFDSTDQSMMTYIYGKFETTFKRKLNKLNHFTDILPDERRLLEFNLRAREGLEYNENMARQIAAVRANTIESILKPNILTNNEFLLSQLTDTILMDKSPYCYDCLFKVVQNNISTRTQTIGRTTFRTDFPTLFSTIQSKYTGKLKYALLTISLTAPISKDSTDFYLDLALNEIPKTNYNYRIVSNIKSKFGKGAIVPDFELLDTSNRKFHLNNLKGKVVIVDFWFTGCPGCRLLANAMDAVHKEFDNNNDVAFVSISIDKNLDQWKKSVLSEAYSKHSIDLYTNGQAEEHPLIQYYGFNGFPQLLLIGKDGRIFYANPPRPSNKNMTQRFVDIVNSAI